VRHELLQLVRENYPAAASRLLKPLLELMVLSRRYCGGDMDKFLIVLVVGLRAAEHPEFAELAPEQLAGDPRHELPGLGTNARSIAASLGIPKETVRRKVSELIEAGWLERQGRNLYYTAHASRALTPVRHHLQQLAVRCFEVVNGLRTSSEDRASSASDR
jgi:hypothetical protein